MWNVGRGADEVNSPEEFYSKRIGEFSAGIGRLQKPLQWIPWLRLVMFIFTGVSIFYIVKFHIAVYPALAILFFSSFLVAGWYDSKLKKEIFRLKALIKINELEINALHGDFFVFNPGNEYINPDHPYTHDLDIFGEGSLFQYVNRATTVYGADRLSDYFSHAFSYSNNILTRQKAIAELSGLTEFRQQLQLIFATRDVARNDLQALEGWLNAPEGLKSKRFLTIMSFLLPMITIGSIVCSFAGLVPYQASIVLVLLQMLIVFSFGRKTSVVHQAVTSQVGILQKYARFLTLTGETKFYSIFNRELQQRLRSAPQTMPDLVIKRLTTLLSLLDSNLNILVSVILNGLFMFNIHVLMAVEKWRMSYRNLVPEWFEVLAEIDALASLGTFAFNNPGYVYPEPVSGEFQFIAENIGHPLIPGGACVVNNLDIRSWNQFCIITGANMSGKSTFLRTIGTNMLLAMTGAPVFASRLIFYPIEIHSSIRTNDSLAKRESYFYAELRRLREIITELEKGSEKLILLDEILKGTNSADKQTGSIALIRQLMKYKIAGLFATHDLALGELIHHYPDNIRNLCFEIHITGNRMEIDYKLSPGVCRNLNASFLMKNMGIILEDNPPA
jgi:hypothetical protein